MEISVITITIDPDKKLFPTLDSVRSQKHINVEHIVVDGVKDREYPRETNGKVFYHEPRGVYEALNFGIKNSTGQIIGMVHGGDRMTSDNILEQIAKAFEENPDIDFVYGDIRYTNGRVYRASNFKPSHLTMGMTPPHPSLYVRRSVFEKIGLYDESFRCGGDIDMWIRLFSDHSFKSLYLPITMVEMSLNGISSSFKARLYANNVDKMKALRKNGYNICPLRLAGKYLLMLRYALKIKK